MLVRLIRRLEKWSRRGRRRMSECGLLALCGAGLTGTGFASAAINRVKRLLPNMIATGDDDGVVKVGAKSQYLLALNLYVCSSGTRGNRKRYGRILTILTSSRTSYGWRTRSTWSVQGRSCPRAESLALANWFMTVATERFQSSTSVQRKSSRLLNPKTRRTSSCP